MPVLCIEYVTSVMWTPFPCLSLHVVNHNHNANTVRMYPGIDTHCACVLA